MSKIPDDIMRAATALFIEIREMQGEPSSAKIEAIAGYLCDERQRHAEVMEEVKKAALEEAARIAERTGRNNEDDWPGETWIAEVIAKEIRALSDSTPTLSQEQKANGAEEAE